MQERVLLQVGVITNLAKDLKRLDSEGKDRYLQELEVDYEDSNVDIFLDFLDNKETHMYLF